MSVTRAPGCAAAVLPPMLLLMMMVSGRSCTLLQLLAAEHQPDQPLPDKKDYFVVSTQPNDVNNSHQQEQVLEIFPRDLRQKEKFLKHLTGPLYFSPKCRTQFIRIYNNTRECTIPALYKRCARSLRRLAESQHCSEG